MTTIPDSFVILAFGSNVGDPETHVRNALKKLSERGFSILRVSSFRRTSPVGCEPDAADFLNGAVSGIWTESPASLLRLCQQIEQEEGRPKVHPHWVSRTLDLDIILFGEARIDTPELKIPHPLALEREFVMTPIAEIAPGAAEFLRSKFPQ